MTVKSIIMSPINFRDPFLVVVTVNPDVFLLFLFEISIVHLKSFASLKAFVPLDSLG